MDLSPFTVFLLDMDGTIYLGDRLFAGTPSFLERLDQTGRHKVFLTNNSSRNGEAYRRKLRRLGLKARPGEIFTSGDATILALLAEQPGASVFLLGTPSLKRSFIQAGFHLWQEKEGGAPDYLVLGFDTTLTYPKLSTACRLAAAGTPYIATHPDFNCPAPEGFIPDAGSIAAMIEASTGKKPRVVGKPQAGMVDALITREGWRREEIVMVGDRLYTDIALGEAAGIATVLVFSGETGRAQYEAQDACRATWAVEDIGVLTPYL